MKKEIIFFLFLSIYYINSKGQKDIFSELKNHRFCGADKMNYTIKKSMKPSNSTQKINRKLSTDYTKIRILVETTYLEVQANSLDSTLKSKFPSIKEALNKAVNGISNLLNVEQLGGDIFENILNEEFFNYYSILQYPKSLINPKNVDADYILLVRFENTNELPSGVLASAMPLYLDEETNRPIIGILTISKNPNYFSLNHFSEYFSTVFIHELTHALGFLDGVFNFFPKKREGTLKQVLEERSGINRTYIITTKVVELAKKYFNCSELIGVELEDQGGQGSSISHWEQRILLGDYMGAIIYQEEMTISEFTLALLEDSGWYKANYYTGGLFRFGKNQGCEFLKNDCINNNNKSNFKNEFFNYEDANSPSCSTGRLSRTYEIIMTYYSNYVENAYQRIKGKYGEIYGGAYYTTDYCFVHAKNSYEGNNNYFEGSCKYGNGNYGNNIYYLNNGLMEKMHPNSEIPESYGEKYTNNSFCIMSTLITKNGNKIFNSIFHPMCYPNFCSDTHLTIQINDQYIVCPKHGGNVVVEGFEGLLHCPDYNLICTGTVLCNDMFDCIEKKSLPKNNTYYYDYEIKATQIYSDLNNGETFIEYELSENGVCPIHCNQCNTDYRCSKCENGFIKVEIYKEKKKIVICDNNTIDVSTNYYLKENDGYYLCFDGCLTCNEEGTNSENNKCLSCKNNYYVIENTNNCYNSEEEAPEGYFFNKESKIFKKCYSGCKTCLMAGIDNNNMNCNSCEEGYKFVEGTNNCVKIESWSKLWYFWLISGIVAVICVIGIIIIIIYCRRKKIKSNVLNKSKTRNSLNSQDIKIIT